MFNGMFKDITNENKKAYKITSPGNYIFYFENKTGELNFDINCQKATVKIYGLYVSNNTQNFTLTINQNHTKRNSISEVLIKSVLKNKSKLTIQSTISIDKNGHNTAANFVNHNILLSNTAQTIISPKLEVIPSDVKCTHATTTKPLNKKQLNYLTTRGIRLLDAKQLLIDGFINEVKNIKKQDL